MSTEHEKLDESKGAPKLKIVRKDGYQTKCTTGFLGKYHNAHHCVPCTSIQNSVDTFLDKKKSRKDAFRKALSWFTNWDVNSGDNLVGLPHQRAYETAYGDLDENEVDKATSRQWMLAKKVVKGISTATVKFPIHLSTRWGHTTYNSNVKEALDDIWKNLNVTIKNHEPVKADDMGGDIQTVSNTYRGQLTGKVGQTKKAWKDDPMSSQFMMAED